MKKNNRILLFGLIIAMSVMLSACMDNSKKTDTSQNEDSSSNPLHEEASSSSSNPFEENDESVMLGSLNHGIAVRNFDEEDNLIPFQYHGGEMQVDYTITAEGSAKNIGFLLFIDGIAQPYKITDSSKEYHYMTMLDIKEDNVQENLTFSFNPVTGKKGETLSLTVLSVYNPHFKPDMIDTTSYGMYHHVLPGVYPIYFEQDATINVFDGEVIANVSQTQENMTDDFKNIKLNNALMDITDEMLNTNVYDRIYYNEKEIMSGNLELKNQMIDVQYILCGVDGAEYTTTFYLDHEAVSQSFNSVIEKGKLSIIDMQIDISKLTKANTFYAISVPTNSEDFQTANVMTLKTASMLLYERSVE